MFRTLLFTFFILYAIYMFTTRNAYRDDSAVISNQMIPEKIEAWNKVIAIEEVPYEHFHYWFGRHSSQNRGNFKDRHFGNVTHIFKYAIITIDNTDYKVQIDFAVPRVGECIPVMINFASIGHSRMSISSQKFKYEKDFVDC